MPIYRGTPEDYFAEYEEYYVEEPRPSPLPRPLTFQIVKPRPVIQQDTTFPNTSEGFKLVIFGGIIVTICFLGWLTYLVVAKK